MLYFGYGSNLHPARLCARVPSAQFVATGFCTGRFLSFRKEGQDGSAKCDAPLTADSESRVYGALYRLNPSGKLTLDQIEGLGKGYEEVLLSVVTSTGVVEALAYVVQTEFIDVRLKPFDWYKTLVLEGAKLHGLPGDYIAEIETVETIP
ncbi:MAG: gamma-glutamylcyclotransferase, partial [bacterium]|nr:gamma-glutamylcyclotransferase [bacterium]